jgi:hypothetical protein
MKSVFCGTQNEGIHTSFVLDKCPDFVSMVDATVVQNEYTPRSRIWIGERYLVLPRSAMKSEANRQVHTTFSLKNSTNLSEVTDPSMMSHVINPSRVRTGRME